MARVLSFLLDQAFGMEHAFFYPLDKLYANDPIVLECSVFAVTHTHTQF